MLKFVYYKLMLLFAGIIPFPTWVTLIEFANATDHLVVENLRMVLTAQLRSVYSRCFCVRLVPPTSGDQLNLRLASKNSS